MSEALDIKKSAPSFVTYIAVISVVLMLVTALSMLLDSVTAGTAKQQNLIQGSAVLIGGTFITFVEIYLMRKRFPRIGFFAGLVGEIGKIATTTIFVTETSTDLLIGLYGATLFSILFSKFFRERIDKLAATGVSRNALNILPTAFILLLFAGGSIFSTLGFGASSQSPNPQDFDITDVDFSLFNEPEWNANYFLDNILDQFLGGLIDPTQIIFNVTNLTPDDYNDPIDPNNVLADARQKPFTYFKENTMDEYKYIYQKAETASFFPSSTGINVFTGDFDAISSNLIPDGTSDVLSLSFSVPIQYTDTYRSSVAVLTNGRTYNTGGESNNIFGSFIDPDSIRVDGQSCIQLGISCRFIENSLPFSGFSDYSNVELDLDGFSTSSSSSVLTYTMDYLLPDNSYSSAYSQDTSYYETVFDANTWNAIQSYYLQLPNKSLGTLHPNFDTYAEWAPTLHTLSQKFDDPTASVFQKAYSIAKEINRSLGLYFDIDLWLGELTGNLEEGTDYPWQDGREDYVEWFLNSKKGTSAHFASLMTVLSRLQGMPARFVTGYALGNTTIDPSVNVVTSFYKHAWTEVLVPLQTPFGPSYEWVIFDPLFFLLPDESIEPPLILDPYSFDQNIPRGFSDQDFYDNVLTSIKRVGVDQNDTNNFDGVYDNVNDSGIIKSDFFDPSPDFGTVHVGVFTAQFTYSIGTKGFFLIGVGDVPLNFQIIKNNSKSVIQWVENYTQPGNTPIQENNISFRTGYVSGFAERSFTNTPSVPGHGSGFISFAVMRGDFKIDDVACNFVQGENNEPSCVSAYSDSDRSIIPGPDGPHDFIDLNIDVSGVDSFLDSIKIDYATHQFQIGTGFTLAHDKINHNLGSNSLKPLVSNLNSVARDSIRLITINPNIDYITINTIDNKLNLDNYSKENYTKFILLLLIPSIFLTIAFSVSKIRKNNT